MTDPVNDPLSVRGPVDPVDPVPSRPFTLGVGVDVVDIPSFAEQLDQPGSTFARSFTGAERRECRRLAATSGNLVQHLAARWAAKEAFYKAWTLADAGDEIPGAQMDWSQIEVVKDRWGRPFIRLAPALEARVSGALQHRFGGGDGSGHAVWHLSLSHDGPVAQAFVVGEWRLD
ncbi:MAG TPA: holo-ACP synthase [Corynebacterium nuruki]|uniref:Holo-[acyl-carrier-protein] synthase n=1 Tax=Corynebacterium nuruki TaxID=1032851 RepID=A0A3D4SW98_9CORY|nr:holo-ACP synthase [Corynebacterium nuruki]HCT13549.1 holo-ACP synthase [Corynebacterium nuruki]